MYKMKEVCRQTGLTEKTVRFYVEQKLVTPKTEPGPHYKSYRFDDADIQRLRDISALRSAEFSVSDIRQMLEEPSAIPELLAQKETSLAEKITALRTVRNTLEHLTLAERTDLSQVADAVEPRTPLRRETPKNRHNRLLWSGIYLGLFLLLGLVIGREKLWLLGISMTFLAGISFPVMAIGYFRYNGRYRRLPQKGRARVVSVIPDEGVDAYWEETALETLYGLMNLGFLHWNWVRPDHWAPLLQLEAEGQIVTTAYRYGGLRNSWHAGDTVEVAWEPGKAEQVYPCGDPVLRRKAWTYLVLGLGAMAGFLLFVGSRFAA